jgi:hypothetical protein
MARVSCDPPLYFQQDKTVSVACLTSAQALGESALLALLFDLPTCVWRTHALRLQSTVLEAFCFEGRIGISAAVCIWPPGELLQHTARVKTGVPVGTSSISISLQNRQAPTKIALRINLRNSSAVNCLVVESPVNIPDNDIGG